MNEARITICVFGVLALIMIAVPLGMLWSAPPSVPETEALKGDVAQFFLTTAPAREPGRSRQVLPQIASVLPQGLAAQAAFDKLTASGFACAPDAGSANCERHYDAGGCQSEWRVSLIFGAGQTLQSSEADRRIACL